MMTKKLMLAAACAAGMFAAEAKVQLGVPFTDGVVLQRERAVPVWGTADAGEKVTVTFAGQRVAATAGADGKWCVKLAPMKASCESRELRANEAVAKELWTRGVKVFHSTGFAGVFFGAALVR